MNRPGFIQTMMQQGSVVHCDSCDYRNFHKNHRVLVIWGSIPSQVIPALKISDALVANKNDSEVGSPHHHHIAPHDKQN